VRKSLSHSNVYPQDWEKNPVFNCRDFVMKMKYRRFKGDLLGLAGFET